MIKHWQSHADAAFCTWKTWGDEIVIYNRTSGETHRLEGDVGSLWFEMRSTPMSTEEVRAYLCQSVDLSPTDLPLDQISELLAGMEYKSLISPVRDGASDDIV